jgi:ABC-type branched-subunit amino acid transport system substrate-binding protein
MRAAQPEALLVVMTERDGSTFMRQLREVGIDVPIYSRGSLTSPLFLEYTADDPTIGEGVIEFSFWAAGLDPEHDAAFLERWGTPNSPHRGMSYYAVRDVIAEAIRVALEENGEVTREGIRDALENLSVDTPIGHIEFDDHNQAYPFGTLQTVENGETVYVGPVELSPVEREVEAEG